MPKSGLWYKTDYNSFYGEPVKKITLEDLYEADTDINRKNKDETPALIGGTYEMNIVPNIEENFNTVRTI